MKVLSAAQSRELEEKAVSSGISYLELMENAGAAAVRFLMKKYSIKGTKVVILCGKGNNGGDGFVIARRLAQQEARVAVVLVEGPPKTEIAARMYEKLSDTFLRIVHYEREESTVSALLYSADLIIDAVYGIGFHGRIAESLESLFAHVQKAYAPVVSIDIPSGVQCDTGAVLGPCIHAQHTVTFSTMKPAHLLPPAKEYCGNITVSPIGISSAIIESQTNCLYVPNNEYVKGLFHPRKPDSNKGDYGRLLCICGSYGMAGAAVLSIRSALRCGAGLVYAALPESDLSHSGGVRSGGGILAFKGEYGFTRYRYGKIAKNHISGFCNLAWMRIRDFSFCRRAFKIVFFGSYSPHHIGC